mgnify:CR=1 FL=1
MNLLWNAIKYTPDGGSISIAVDGDGQTARVKVTDTGMGIPPTCSSASSSCSSRGSARSIARRAVSASA